MEASASIEEDANSSILQKFARNISKVLSVKTKIVPKDIRKVVNMKKANLDVGEQNVTISIILLQAVVLKVWNINVKAAKMYGQIRLV